MLEAVLGRRIFCITEAFRPTGMVEGSIVGFLLDHVSLLVLSWLMNVFKLPAELFRLLDSRYPALGLWTGVGLGCLAFAKLWIVAERGS